MNNIIDYFIDSRGNDTFEASFEFYFKESITIKSITLKNIIFYNSWWTTDIQEGDIHLIGLGNRLGIIGSAFIPREGHYSLADVCGYFTNLIQQSEIDHVKMYCDKNNYITLELTEDKLFDINAAFLDGNRTALMLVNKWFGFKQNQFERKGKYYSIKPLNFYRTDLFLRSNLVDKEHTFYNNKHSDIFCVFPVDDGDQIKLQNYEPNNCTKNVNKTTNYIQFEITDEKEKVINFRGKPVLMHIVLELST